MQLFDTSESEKELEVGRLDVEVSLRYDTFRSGPRALASSHLTAVVVSH